MGKKLKFKTGDHAVYPSHGVGKIKKVEKINILGNDYKCYIMYFEDEKLTIKIPEIQAKTVGLRHLVTKREIQKVFEILRSGVKKLKGMWSRRAQEYESKINSGDIILLAEVLRDLTRDIEDAERSYSERIIYETAVNRLASEFCIIENISLKEAQDKIIAIAKEDIVSENQELDEEENFVNDNQKEDDFDDDFTDDFDDDDDDVKLAA